MAKVQLDSGLIVDMTVVELLEYEQLRSAKSANTHPNYTVEASPMAKKPSLDSKQRTQSKGLSQTSRSRDPQAEQKSYSSSNTQAFKNAGYRNISTVRAAMHVLFAYPEREWTAAGVIVSTHPITDAVVAMSGLSLEAVGKMCLLSTRKSDKITEWACSLDRATVAYINQTVRTANSLTVVPVAGDGGASYAAQTSRVKANDNNHIHTTMPDWLATAILWYSHTVVGLTEYEVETLLSWPKETVYKADLSSPIKVHHYVQNLELSSDYSIAAGGTLAGLSQIARSVVERYVPETHSKRALRLPQRVEMLDEAITFLFGK